MNVKKSFMRIQVDAILATYPVRHAQTLFSVILAKQIQVLWVLCVNAILDMVETFITIAHYVMLHAIIAVKIIRNAKNAMTDII